MGVVRLVFLFCIDFFDSSRADHARSLNDIEANLPADAEAKEEAINDAIVERTARFLSTHSMEVSFPQDQPQPLEEEGERRISVH